MVRVSEGAVSGNIAASAVSFRLPSGEGQVAAVATPLPVALAYNGEVDISSAPLKDYVPVVPGPAVLAGGNCRAILVTVAGTVNLTTPAGVDRDGVPCAVGENRYAASKVRVGGTATGVFAGY